MKRVNSFVFITLFSLLLSCKREKVNFLGPAYVSAPPEFTVVNFTATPAAVNFTTTDVTLNAAFSHVVTWKLTIQGMQSGAVYETQGISNGLNNIKWTGRHTGLAFFRTGEKAVATLSFFGNPITYSTEITILKAPDYTKCGVFAVDGDFEIPSKINFPYWARFNVAQQGVDSAAIDYKGNKVPSIQGKCYYYIKGLGNQQVFVDGIQYIGPLQPKLPRDPDSVWVNMYIYGTGDPNAGVELEYQEEDFDGTSLGYNGKDDDAFVAKIKLDHTGWKLFSFQYSKLVPSLNADFGGSGNKIREPHTLKSFDLVLLKLNNPNAPVEVYFDYPIITVGGPFKPCK